MNINKKEVIILFKALERYFETNLYFTKHDICRLYLSSNIWKYKTNSQRHTLVITALDMIIDKKIAYLANPKHIKPLDYKMQSLIHDDNVYEPFAKKEEFSSKEKEYYPPHLSI